MLTRWLTPQIAVPVVILGVVAGQIVFMNMGGRRETSRRPPVTSEPYARTVAFTSAAGLDETVRETGRRLSVDPADVRAAVQFADASMRLARVRSDGGLVARSTEALREALDRNPGDYAAQQMLGTLYLSSHKFTQAIDVAERTRRLRPLDPTNLGILGDARLELGDYDGAFDAYDEMVRLRPSAASYARVAYARELQGNLTGALESMQLALAAVPPGDLESLAWHHAQVGDLYLKLGDTMRAEQSFITASNAYPGHPFAVLGYARALAARGDRRAAIRALQVDSGTNSPDRHALLGALLDADGQHDQAAVEFALAEAAWRGDSSEPRNLAKLLVSRGRVDEAVTIAETAAQSRDDIFTNDALAWAYYKAGRVSQADRAIARALRTGTRDADILAHAAAIRGKQQAAR